MEQHPISKKRLLGSVIAVMALILVTGLLIYLMQPRTMDITSKSGNLTIYQATEGMQIHDGVALSGITKLIDKTSLYYIVTANHKAIGSGNIAVQANGHFSRNLTINMKNQHGKAGELEVYIQDQRGRLLDSVSIGILLQ